MTITNEDLLVTAHQRGVRTARAHRPAYSGNPAQLAKDLYPLDEEERFAFFSGYVREKARLEAR